jgi:hypothetical protein
MNVCVARTRRFGVVVYGTWACEDVFESLYHISQSMEKTT